MSKRICPVCGIGILEKIPSTITLTDPSGIEKTIEVSEYKCPACEAEGDMFGENDRAIQDEYKKMRADAVVSILKEFSGKDTSYSAVERVLGLPQRTLSKWKNKSIVPSAGATALMRYIHLFPWLLEIADNKFEKKSAIRIHIAAAMRDLCEMTKASDVANISAGIVENIDNAVFYVNMEKGITQRSIIDTITSASAGLMVHSGACEYSYET
jgi:DNA-binding transcriptional regulator YiaG